jgi:hypothetical protein
VITSSAPAGGDGAREPLVQIAPKLSSSVQERVGLGHEHEGIPQAPGRETTAGALEGRFPLIVGVAAFVRTGGIREIRRQVEAAGSTTATTTADALARLEQRIRGKGEKGSSDAA